MRFYCFLSALIIVRALDFTYIQERATILVFLASVAFAWDVAEILILYFKK